MRHRVKGVQFGDARGQLPPQRGDAPLAREEGRRAQADTEIEGEGQGRGEEIEARIVRRMGDVVGEREERQRHGRDAEPAPIAERPGPEDDREVEEVGDRDILRGTRIDRGDRRFEEDDQEERQTQGTIAARRIHNDSE